MGNAIVEREAIAKVLVDDGKIPNSRPESDPVFGNDGGLVKKWRA
jgi:hypothetical protein